MKVQEAIRQLEKAMAEEWIVPSKGLGDELFLFSSTLVPVVNVDLLITDNAGRVLLKWRDDLIEGQGWHIPGRCIRFHETTEESIRNCARDELGIRVEFYPEPVGVYEGIRAKEIAGLENQDYRSHFITLLYACRVADNDDSGSIFKDPDKIKWFDTIPEDIVEGQQRYFCEWDSILKKAAGIRNGQDGMD